MKRSFLIIPLFCAVSVYAADKIYLYNSPELKVRINNVSQWSGDLHKETGTIYDPNGYDKNGYDQNGFDINGIHRDTGTIYDPDGFNIQGIDAEGYNKAGFNESGYDRQGYNAAGYDRQGYDVNGLGVEDCNLNINFFRSQYEEWGCNNYARLFYGYINGSYRPQMHLSTFSDFHNLNGYRYYLRPGFEFRFDSSGFSPCSIKTPNPSGGGYYSYYIAPVCRKAIKR